MIYERVYNGDLSSWFLFFRPFRKSSRYLVALILDETECRNIDNVVSQRKLIEARVQWYIATTCWRVASLGTRNENSQLFASGSGFHPISCLSFNIVARLFLTWFFKYKCIQGWMESTAISHVGVNPTR